MATNTDFINSNGSYNVAAIMAVAHRQARHGLNTTLVVLAGIKVRPTLSQAEATYAQIAATLDRTALRIPATLTYAAELRKALAECWWQARVMRSRFVPAKPVAFKIAA